MNHVEDHDSPTYKKNTMKRQHGNTIRLGSIIIVPFISMVLLLHSYQELLKPFSLTSDRSAELLEGTAVSQTKDFRILDESASNATVKEISVPADAFAGEPSLLPPATDSTPTIVHSAYLKSGPDLQANNEQIAFAANFTLSALGKACFNFVVADASACPHPYIRVRLSGSALVHVPLLRTSSIEIQLEGCAFLPVPGTYFVDANLLHCAMNLANERLTPVKIKKGRRPVYPALLERFAPHRFEMPPFQRDTSLIQPKNAYPSYAWVQVPLCNGHQISPQCTENRNLTPQFIPTKFQTKEFSRIHRLSDNWRSPKLHKRYDDYLWLPVSFSNGVIDYTAEFAAYEYAAPPSFIQSLPQNNQTVLFVGASHVRYLISQVAQIYYNMTYGTDGCIENHAVEKKNSRFNFTQLKFADQWLRQKPEHVLDHVGTNFDKYILLLGHWDAGYPRKKPTMPRFFLKALMGIIELLEKLTKPGAEIFVLSVNQHPPGIKMLINQDWRVPPMIDAYNEAIWSQVEVELPVKSSKSFRFRNHPRTYFVDNTDIMDPVWDSATDWYHPCRYAIRPMALRVLDLLTLS